MALIPPLMIFTSFSHRGRLLCWISRQYVYLTLIPVITLLVFSTCMETTHWVTVVQQGLIKGRSLNSHFKKNKRTTSCIKYHPCSDTFFFLRNRLTRFVIHEFVIKHSFFFSFHTLLFSIVSTLSLHSFTYYTQRRKYLSLIPIITIF